MRILRLPDTMAKVGLRDVQIYHLMKAGRFPRSVPLGPKCVGWVEQELDDWIAQRISERDSHRGERPKKTIHAAIEALAARREREAADADPGK